MVHGNESLVFEQYSEKQLRIVIGFLQLGVSCSAQDTQTLQSGRSTEETFGSNTSYGPSYYLQSNLLLFTKYLFATFLLAMAVLMRLLQGNYRVLSFYCTYKVTTLLFWVLIKGYLQSTLPLLTKSLHGKQSSY